MFYEPQGVHRGRAAIDRIAGAIRMTHPDFQYTPTALPEELGNGGRIRWVSGPPGKAPAYAGTDFIIVSDDRIAALYLFFDALVDGESATVDERSDMSNRDSKGKDAALNFDDLRVGRTPS